MATLSVGGQLVATNDTLSNGVQDNITRLGTVTAGTINSTTTIASRDNTVKAWGRIEDNVLTSNHGISGITTSGAGSATRTWLITMSPAMANDDYAVVTTGYAHEGGQVEGLVQWFTGTSGTDPTTTQFKIQFTGNATSAINCIGFAVFGT